VASERKERIARNEALFREANERMAGWEEQHADGEAEIYYCECADTSCRDRVTLTRSEYRYVRSDPRYFVIVPGHDIEDVETVIDEHDGWWLIEKPAEVDHIVDGPGASDGD